MGDGSDEAWIAQQVAQACDEILDSANHRVLNVDWNDLGEVTIATEIGTFRATFVRLGDDDD